MSQSAQPGSDHLTDRTTLDCTIKTLQQTFGLSADGYVCHTEDLYQILASAAARRSTMEATCNDFLNGPDSNTVRGYLTAQLAPLAIQDLERQCNRGLAKRWPHWLYSQPLEVAADLHDEPYYGAYDEQDPDQWVLKGQKQRGTRHCYRCATLFVVRHQVRLTLAVVFVHPDEDLVAILQKLLKIVRARGLHLARLYADKGFCSIAVLQYLRSQPGLSAIIAVPRKGSVEGHGIRSLCRGRRSYRTTHCFRGGGAEFTADVAVVRAYKEHHGRRTLTWLVYALLRVDDPLRQIRERYRRRFGIDTSYRLMERVRVRTTCTLPALRFFLMGLALILVNVWVSLQWQYCRVRGSGPRRIDRSRLTLERLAHFLIHAVEAIYGVVSAIDSSPPNL